MNPGETQLLLRVAVKCYFNYEYWKIVHLVVIVFRYY